MPSYDFFHSLYYFTLKFVKEKLIDLIERHFQRAGYPYLACYYRNALFTLEQPKNNAWSSQNVCLLNNILYDFALSCIDKLSEYRNYLTKMYCVHGHKNGHFVSLVYALLQGKSDIVYLWDSISSSEKNTDFGLKIRLKDSSTKIGKRLEHSFGLYLLCPDVEDSYHYLVIT